MHNPSVTPRSDSPGAYTGLSKRWGALLSSSGQRGGKVDSYIIRPHTTLLRNLDGRILRMMKDYCNQFVLEYMPEALNHAAFFICYNVTALADKSG